MSGKASKWENLLYWVKLDFSKPPVKHCTVTSIFFLSQTVDTLEIFPYLIVLILLKMRTLSTDLLCQTGQGTLSFRGNMWRLLPVSPGLLCDRH